MITPAFIWLLTSHLSILFPIYLGFKLNINKWKTPLLVLIITAFFSCLYHWDDQENYNDELIFLGTKHFVHKYMDYYGSYLSFLIIIFYTINIDRKSKYFDFFLVLINILSVFLALVNISWYIFVCIVIFFILYYLYIIDNCYLILMIIKTFWKNKLITLLTLCFFIIAMVMQYNLCFIHNDGFYYQLYHGFWHFFLFLAAGMCMIINKLLLNIIVEENNSKKIFCFEV